MPRPEKVEKINELDEIFSKAQSVYLADFTGMSVELTNKLRSQFREKNVGYKVIKNTFAKRAVAEKEYKDLNDHFEGPTAIAYSFEDPILPSKIIIDFARENEIPVLKASLVEGKAYDTDQTKELAKIPSKEILLSKMVGGLKSPINGLVFTLNGIIRNLVYVLDSVKEEKSKSEN
jgi:large subunit ribosomal protein L10